MHKLEKNLLQVQNRIQAATAIAGRNADDVTLLAVSKRQSAELISEAHAAGQRDFGENYLQEALEKRALLKHLDCCWHFIGPIQSNKTKAIAENFDWVHSVDRLKIAQRLSDQRPENLAPLQLCLQVNIDNEDSKSGINADELFNIAEEVATMRSVQLRGLMAIPMARSEYNEQRAAFKALKALFEALKSHSFASDIDTLSMGMSGDLEAAIAEGATIVRIGTAIFGERLN